MSKIVKQETVTIEKVIGFKCDRCGTEINRENSTRTDDFSINYSFGYGTESDGVHIEADICDNCLMEIIQNEIPKANIGRYF